MFNKHNLNKNSYMLNGSFKKRGYDWWWHSFTAIDEETKESQAFYIEYYIINPKLSKDKVLFGSTDGKPSYLMVNVGAWGKGKKAQLHRFFKLSDVKIDKYPYSIVADDCFASDCLLKGSVNISEEDKEKHPEWLSDSGSMEWELKIEKDIAFNVGYGTSKFLRFIKAFQMYWHAEGMKSYYDGYVVYNGRKYIVSRENSFGYADKNWGRGFTSPWIWLSSNNIYSNVRESHLTNTVFDIGGGRPKVYFIPFNKKLLGALYLEGSEYEFNFSKFWHPTKTKFDCMVTDELVTWDISQKCKKYKMITHIECKRCDMLEIKYEDPDGEIKHKHLYNGGNGYGNFKLYYKDELIEDANCYNVGCEYGVFDNDK